MNTQITRQKFKTRILLGGIGAMKMNLHRGTVGIQDILQHFQLVVSQGSYDRLILFTFIRGTSVTSPVERLLIELQCNKSFKWHAGVGIGLLSPFVVKFLRRHL